MNTHNEHDWRNEDWETHDSPETDGTPEAARVVPQWMEESIASVRKQASYLLGFTNEHGDEEEHPSLGSHVGTSVDRITGPTLRETQYLLASTDEQGRPEQHETFAKRAGTVASRIVERTVHVVHVFAEWVRSFFPKQSAEESEPVTMPHDDDDGSEIQF